MSRLISETFSLKFPFADTPDAPRSINPGCDQVCRTITPEQSRILSAHCMEAMIGAVILMINTTKLMIDAVKHDWQDFFKLSRIWLAQFTIPSLIV